MIEFRLDDPASRVSRAMRRRTPGGELVIIELAFGYRGEIFTEGGEEGRDLVMLRCRSTRTGRWDAATERKLIALSWTRIPNSMILRSWSKGTLTLLIAPVLNWMPSETRFWTAIKDT